MSARVDAGAEQEDVQQSAEGERGSVGPRLLARGLCKTFAMGQSEVEVFRDLGFAVADGEMVAIIGESGVGKSSLLHLLAALDRPSSGEIWYEDVRVDRLRPREAAAFRNRKVGYVWQFHYLLPEFLAWENVAMPLLARGEGARDARRRAEELLDEVGLGARRAHRAGELSGGEQQRVSIARALVTRPRLLLADEPTGDLDERTAGLLFALLREMHARRGLTTVLVTHNRGFAERCDRVLELRGGGLHMIGVGAAEGDNGCVAEMNR